MINIIIILLLLSIILVIIKNINNEKYKIARIAATLMARSIHSCKKCDLYLLCDKTTKASKKNGKIYPCFNFIYNFLIGNKKEVTNDKRV